MRARTRTNLLVFVASVIAVFTLLTFRGATSLLATLHGHRLHHVEAARLEAEAIPFTERGHRLERKPRLEASNTPPGELLPSNAHICILCSTVA